MSREGFNQKLDKFYRLNKFETTDFFVLVIEDNLSKMACDLNKRFSNLKEIDFSSWIKTQPLIVKSTAVSLRH